ncbi:MAG TPA: phosphatase PAP2 family protein, partial [Acidimicrobiales bacterium]
LICLALTAGAAAATGTAWLAPAGAAPARRRLAGGAVVGGAVFLVLLAMVAGDWGLATADPGVSRFAAAPATAASTDGLRVITWFGGAALIVPIATIVGAVEARRRGSWRPVGFLAAVVAGEVLLADGFKAVVGRARPDVLRLTGFSGPSFPSGHATAAAAVFAACAVVLGRGRSRGAGAVLAAAAVGAAVLIAATRVMLGVHWLTDVVAGLCLGWTWFAVMSLAWAGNTAAPRTAPRPPSAASPDRACPTPKRQEDQEP